MIIEFTSEDLCSLIIPQPTWALISITEPERLNPNSQFYKPPVWDKWTNHIILGFHDIDAKNKPEIYQDPYVVFNQDHASQIINFIEALPDNTEKIVVHCSAGVSRSGAIARFLSEDVYECVCYRSFFDYPVNWQRYMAENKWILHCLEKEFDERRTKE